MNNKLKIFIQFQDSNDLTNILKLNENISDFTSSKLLSSKILNKFDIYSYIIGESEAYKYFIKKQYSWLKNTIFTSKIDEDNNINTDLLNYEQLNVLITIDSKNDSNKYTLYDDIIIIDGQILNATNPREEVNKYYYNSFNEIYQHLDYMYCLEK